MTRPAHETDAPVGAQRAAIEVPLHHPHRQDLLREEWRRQLGHLSHVRHLRLPPARAGGVYRSRVERRLVGDVAMSRQYSDRIEGVSGRGSADARADLVGVHVIGSGALRVADSARITDIGPGMLCVRDLQAPWDFTFTLPTSSRVLILPRSSLLDHLPARRLPPLTVASTASAESRMLLAHLDTAWALSGQLGPAGTNAAGSTLLALLAAVVTTYAPASAALPRHPLVEAARACADSRLRDADLDPSAIALALNVSVRTLHRAFANSNSGSGSGSGSESVMAYVRSRRLEHARTELTGPDGPFTVTEVAARWHFADTSHFRRAYRNAYGHPPRQT